MHKPACLGASMRWWVVLAAVVLSPAFPGEATASDTYAADCATLPVDNCYEVGRKRLRDPVTHAEGLGLLIANCRRRHADSCVLAAAQTAPKLSRQVDCAASEMLGALACQEGQPEGCVFADACALDRPRKRAVAVARLEQACQDRTPLACYYWAEAAGGLTASLPTDMARARRAYQVACRSQSVAASLACTRLAVEDLAAATSQEAASRARGTLFRNCDDGVGLACCQLSAGYRDGKWSLLDEHEAARFRARACGLGENTCCSPSRRSGASR